MESVLRNSYKKVVNFDGSDNEDEKSFDLDQFTEENIDASYLSSFHESEEDEFESKCI